MAHETLGVRHFFKLVLNVDLDLDNFVCVGGVLNLGSDFACLHVHAGLEERLGVVELVLGHVGVELRQLVIVFGGLRVVLNVEKTVGEQGQGGTTARRKLKLVIEDGDDLCESRGLTSWYF